MSAPAPDPAGPSSSPRRDGAWLERLLLGLVPGFVLGGVTTVAAGPGAGLAVLAVVTLAIVAASGRWFRPTA